MTRILHNDSWYSPVKSSSIYEKTYEQKILENSNMLFPSYFCYYFKKEVQSMWGPGIPDLVLIDKQYREWIIVEVELEHHNLQGDVEQQVKIFSSAKYGKVHAEYLFRKHPDLDFEKLCSLVVGTQPSITVIVPIAKPSWWKNLLPYNAHIAVVEVWQNNIGKQLLRINGDQPAPLEAEFLTKVFRDSDVTLKGLRVDNPAVLQDIEKIQIYIENELTIWRQVRTVTNCWLVPDGKPPIDDIDSMAFNLLVDSSGNFLLKAAR